MSNSTNPTPDFQAWLFTILQQAKDIGFAQGFELGVAQGFELGVLAGYAKSQEETKSAVSDGLRNGSSECGKNMRYRHKDQD